MIFYLSCTGNTLWAARQIAHATGEELVDITALPDRPHTFTLDEGERLGFCFPVHCWRPPMLYRRFLSQLRISSPQPLFAYALCTAGDDIGRTIDILREDLRHVGVKLQAAWSLVMPETYVGLPFMDVDKPKNERRKISDSQQRLDRILPAIVERRSEGVANLDIGSMPRLKSGVVAAAFNRWWVNDRWFRVDTARCIHCRRCEQVCPVDDISCDGDTPTPQWKHNGRCLTCLSCYHHCPAHAISFAGQTQNKGQYYFNHK